MYNNIHIVKIIYDKFKESGLTVSEFAIKINRTRTTVYDIFKRDSIDTALLMDISEILHYNFMEEIYQKNHNIKTNTDFKQENKFHHYHISIEIDENQLKQILSNNKNIVHEFVEKN